MFIESVKTYETKIDKSLLTKEQLKVIDCEGIERLWCDIKIKNINDEYYSIIANLVSLQYSLPMKYLKYIDNTYQYISQKTNLIGNTKDIAKADILIEPINPDIVQVIQQLPINQKLPIDTQVMLDISLGYNELNRKFIWSNNLQFINNFDEKVLTGHYKKPWLQCAEIGTIDIGSHITAKFSVSWVNTDLLKSYSLFNFERSDKDKLLRIYIFKFNNVTIKELFKLMYEHKNIKPNAKKFVEEILKKIK